MMEYYLKLSVWKSSRELFSEIVINLLGAVTAKNVTKHYAGSALLNLTRTVDILNTSPLGYVSDAYEGILYCLHEEAAKKGIKFGWLVLLQLVFISGWKVTNLVDECT